MAPGPVKISHKKDGHQRWLHRFHVSRPPPLAVRWIRYWEIELSEKVWLMAKYRLIILNKIHSKIVYNLCETHQSPSAPSNFHLTVNQERL